MAAWHSHISSPLRRPGLETGSGIIKAGLCRPRAHPQSRSEETGERVRAPYVSLSLSCSNMHARSGELEARDDDGSMCPHTHTHTRVHPVHVAHVQTRTPYNELRQVERVHLFPFVSGACVFVCLPRLKDNEKVCSGSLRCDGTTGGRERARARGNKLNGEWGCRWGGEDDWESRWREQVYMLCCCSALGF